MFPLPVPKLQSNTAEFENTPLVKPTGFREYDARWFFGKKQGREPELNLMGVQAIGLGLGTLIQELGAGPDIVVGHDFRAYSISIKHSLVAGLIAAGARVRDIGLALSPVAYYAQFALNIPSVAMVTASHNDNGWTGIKMGYQRPLTFGPDEMNRLRDIVLGGKWKFASGSYEFISDFAARYIDDLTSRKPFSRKIRAIVACGNGTAGAFAPIVLERLGVDVEPMDIELDHSFPNYNPDPENMKMLGMMAERIRQCNADMALGFDGDGDRCGVIDGKGQVIFADKVGVMLARDIASAYDNRQFVVDVKSTSLFLTDPVLKKLGTKTDYYKTGHSYIKHRVNELGAIAGFEKSGHFFFNSPIGRGYDDALVTAIAICDMLDRNMDVSMADLYQSLPRVYGSPSISVHCADETKYSVVDKALKRFQTMRENGERFGNQVIHEIVTVNGARVIMEDGTWGLVRASSNEPRIVIVAESPVSELRRNEMLDATGKLLRTIPGMEQKDFSSCHIQSVPCNPI